MFVLCPCVARAMADAGRGGGTVCRGRPLLRAGQARSVADGASAGQHIRYLCCLEAYRHAWAVAVPQGRLGAGPLSRPYRLRLCSAMAWHAFPPSQSPPSTFALCVLRVLCVPASVLRALCQQAISRGGSCHCV
eukprot:3978265-Prymnesium_polylepis.2